MKEHNINAIRTSHYPNDKYLYYLADKYGFLVLAECNIECHGTGSDETHTALGHDFVNGDRSRCDALKTSRFQDVKPGSFFDPVEWAVEKGITTGISEELFDPDGKCMRAVVVTFLWRAK